MSYFALTTGAANVMITESAKALAKRQILAGLGLATFADHLFGSCRRQDGKQGHLTCHSRIADAGMF
jgi:hypothetical protein